MRACLIIFLAFAVLISLLLAKPGDLFRWLRRKVVPGNPFQPDRTPEGEKRQAQRDREFADRLRDQRGNNLK